MAQQFAQDVLLVRDVLIENSLDPSIAPQLAISIQSSQHIIDSQREIGYQKAVLDAHQRSLDRQLSEKQHRESLQSAHYDPNWEEKLQAMRDQCYYWNVVNGGVSRLWLEVFLIQQLAAGFSPVWQRYLRYSRGYNASASIDKVGNFDGLNSFITSVLKDTFASVLAQVCDCQSSNKGEENVSTSLTGNESTTSFILQNVMLPSFTFSFDVLNQVLSSPIQYWTCYGYCIILASTLLFVTIVFHHGIRILSLPKRMHHIVNFSSLSLFYGPQRTLKFIFTTLMRMVMVMPTIDYVDTDIKSDGSFQQEQLWQQHNGSRRFVYSFLLLSIWVFVPISNWTQISRLYHESASRITRADAINFETSFRNGISRLKRSYREHMTMRYIFLSIYSAMVLLEDKGMK